MISVSIKSLGKSMNTLRFKHLLLLFLSIIFLPFSISAQEENELVSLTELKQLFDKDAYSEVYLTAQTLLYDYEGTPQFDLIYGVSALETGHLS